MFARVLAAIMLAVALPTVAQADAKVAKSTGTAKVIYKGQESGAEERLNQTLAPGTVVTTGPDGKVVIELAPGFVIELQPNSQITIGETTLGNDVVDELGNPIPRHTFTLNIGTIVSQTTEAGLATAALVVVTPRGLVSPVIPGQTVITVTGADPARATVTVASVTGSEMVTKTSGEQLPVAEGLAVILRPEGEEDWGPGLIDELPGGVGPGILAMAQSAADTISGLTNLTPAIPPPVLPAQPADGGIPPNQPTGQPTPTATPIPTPTPTPTPAPTPSPAPVSP